MANNILARSLSDLSSKGHNAGLEHEDPSTSRSPYPLVVNGELLNESDKDRSSSRFVRTPLSRDASIYFQTIGLKSTIQSKTDPQPKSTLSQKPTARQTLNTINSKGDQCAGKEKVVISGYGLADFSSSDESDAEPQSNCRDFREPGRGYGLFGSDSDISSDSDSDELYSDDKNCISERGATRRNTASTGHAHYVAHITGRMDPWEKKMQKVREESKDLAPLVAEKITQDFDVINQKTKASMISWARDNEDITQRVKSMALETEAVKEKRRKEIDIKNNAMKKEIDDCLAKVKEERETAIRIREEAARAVQLEKERLEKEVEDKKKAEEAAKVAREEIAKANAQAVATASAAKAKQQAAAAAQHQASTTSTVFASDSANREYDHYISVLNHLKQNVDPAVSNDPATKKYCFAQRREIRAIIGQLVNIKKEIFRVATELDSMFKETMRTRGAAAYYWVMNTTAKKLVKQAETEALVTASHTFPLAHVAVLLFTNHEKFKDVLMARFSKKCPYVIPKYFAKEPTETPDQFLKKLGYTMKEKGWESEAQYDARQCGMFSLYCAIMQTTPQVGQNLYPLSQGWTWMARIINMPPHPITPALITVFLEVCGHGYMRAYRQQANKVLQLLMSDFIPLIPKEGVAGTTRLKTLLENLLKTGQIPVPEGREFDG